MDCLHASLLALVVACALGAEPAMPSRPVDLNLLGQQITIPGPVFPKYSDTIPVHHLPDSPQAISSSDVTFPIQSRPAALALSEGEAPVVSTNHANDNATTEAIAVIVPNATRPSANVATPSIAAPREVTTNHTAPAPQPALLRPLRTQPSIQPFLTHPNQLSLHNSNNQFAQNTLSWNILSMFAPKQFPSAHLLTKPKQPQQISAPVIAGNTRPSVPDYHIRGGRENAHTTHHTQQVQQNQQQQMFAQQFLPNMNFGNVPFLMNPLGNQFPFGGPQVGGW